MDELTHGLRGGVRGRAKTFLLLGMNCITFTWSPLYGTSEAVVFSWLESVPQHVFGARMVGLALFALTCILLVFARSGGRLSSLVFPHMTLPATVYFFGMLLGCACGLQVLGIWALYAGAALRGISALWIHVSWISLMARQNREMVGPVFAFSLGLYGLLGIVLIPLVRYSPIGSAVVLCALPVACCLAFRSLRREAEGPVLPISEQPAPIFSSRHKKKTLVVNLVYGFLYGAFLFYFSEKTSVLSLAVFCIAAFGLSILVGKLGSSVGIPGIFRGFMLTSALLGIVVTLIGALGCNLSLALASGMLMVMIFYTNMIFIDVTMDTSNEDWALLAGCLLFSSCGIGASSALMYFAGIDNLDDSSILFIALACASFVAVIFMPNQRSMTSGWGFSSMLPIESPEVRLMRRCGEIAEKRGLTARELEVLQLLAVGERKDDIAEALFISPHTAKTHIHNLYVKLEIKSAKELKDLLG